jgi:hypothetical protein
MRNSARHVLGKDAVFSRSRGEHNFFINDSEAEKYDEFNGVLVFKVARSIHFDIWP